MDTADALRELHRSFNARDADAVLAALAPDVKWPNGWEGGWVEGREAVRVHQTVRLHDGELLDDLTLVHAYRFGDDGLVTQMDIEPQARRGPCAVGVGLAASRA